MKHTDFQGVLGRIQNLEGPERGKIESGLMLELDLLRHGQLDERDLPTYKNWREWLKDHHAKWHDDEGRYVGTGDDLNFLKAELWIFLHHFKEYLAECDNCGQFFVKTNRRPQRFCKRQDRACRDKFHTGKRKTPEGRKERAAYMRKLRTDKRRRRRARERKRERERLDKIPDAK
jgi:hypothetical protein